MFSRFPLTRFGLSTAMLGSFAVGFGWMFGWLEVLILGTGCLLALTLAVPYILGGHELRLSRAVEPTRVEVGQAAFSTITVTNGASRASGQRLMTDRIGGQHFVEAVPLIKSGDSHKIQRRLPTDRRGVIKVGPAVLAKADPLGLMGRDLGRTGESDLYVHPRVASLVPLQAGFAKDLDGPTFDSSPAGSVAFHAIREYEVGDDARHVHWMSTARTGTLMVRHYVDNRRPYLAVIVDTDPAAMSPEQFERGLEVAASQLVSAALDSRPLVVRVGSQPVLTGRHPTTTDGALERLCFSEQSGSESDLAIAVEEARRSDPEISAFLVVTGPRPAVELLKVITSASKQGRVIITRFVEFGEDPTAVPRARVFDCQTLEDFGHHWTALAR